MSTIETALATPRKPIRVWPGVIAVVAMAGLVCRSCDFSSSTNRRAVVWRHRWIGHPCLVAALQSRALDRAHRRSRADRARTDRDEASRARVDCRWRNGHAALHSRDSSVQYGIGFVGRRFSSFLYCKTASGVCCNADDWLRRVYVSSN